MTAYRNPRFSLLHTLREANARKAQPTDQQTTLGLGTADVNTPISWLYDGRHRALFKASVSAGNDIRVETQRVDSTHERREVNRLIVPRGHNLGQSKGRMRVLGERETGVWESFQDEASAPISAYVALTDDLVDLELTALVTSGEVGLQAGGLRWEMIDCDPAWVMELPELYWTNTVQPTTGVVQAFEPGEYTPNRVDATSRGGTEYTFERGRALRTFKFRHRALSGADWALYERVVAEAMQGSGHLFYEHPGTGEAFEIIDDCSDPSRWIVGSGTIASAPEWRYPPGAIRWTATGTGTHILQQNLPAERDLRGKMFRVTVRPFGDVSWLTVANSIDFRVASFSTEHESRYWIADSMLVDASPARYWTFYVDLDQVAEQQGLYGPCDLSKADRFRFRWAPTVIGQEVDIDQIALIDKPSQPTLCKITRYDSVQDHPNPKGPDGPTYTVDMELREVFV